MPTYNIFDEIKKEWSLWYRIKYEIVTFPTWLKIKLSNMKNPFTYNFKHTHHELFIWFGLNYKHTIFKFERNTWYHVYSLVIFGITLYKKVNYEMYKKNVERFKKENGL